MARIRIEDENREIVDHQEIRDFLAPFGIWYECWGVKTGVTEDASNDDILSAYENEVNHLKVRGGFVTADVINVNADTPGLDEMLAKFRKEHTHSEDEVRFTISGAGVFHIHPEDGPVFGVLVEAGDMINVPAGTRHWFDLCDDRQIRCIRLFQDPSGWTPHYVDDPVHEKYSPLCFGPNYIDESIDFDPVVKV